MLARKSRLPVVARHGTNDQSTMIIAAAALESIGFADLELHSFLCSRSVGSRVVFTIGRDCQHGGTKNEERGTGG